MLRVLFVPRAGFVPALPGTRVALGRVVHFTPATASPCGANDGSLKKRPRLPIQRCSTCRRPASQAHSIAAGCSCPFDRPVIAERAPQNPRGRPRRWGHHLRAHLAEMRAFTDTCARLQRAAIDILPFQLEPALALIRGTRIAISPRRRSRPRQDDTGGADARGTAPPRLVRPRDHHDSAGAAAAVGRRAAAPVRHSIGRHRRRIVVLARRLAALRRQSMDVRACRHHVDRFHQTTRGLAGTGRTTVGSRHRRRSASGCRRLAAERRPFRRSRHAHDTSCWSPPRLTRATSRPIARSAISDSSRRRSPCAVPPDARAGRAPTQHVARICSPCGRPPTR